MLGEILKSLIFHFSSDEYRIILGVRCHDNEIIYTHTRQYNNSPRIVRDDRRLTN